MAAMVNMNSLLNGKDSRWLQLEVCREFQRNKCSRQDTECKFAHPPANVEVQNGKVTACYDSIKGRCNRDKPPCKYFHPPQHLKDQLLINGRNHLALKNALMQQMGIAPGQTVIPGQMPTVATSPYLPGIPANTYSPYFAGPLVPALLGPDPSAVASQLGPVVPQAVQVAQQKIPRSDRLETAPVSVSAATLTQHHPTAIPTPGVAHPAPQTSAAVAIGQHPLEVGKKRAAENDMFPLMDVKTAFSGMVPYKRPATEKSGIPVYQPGTTTYQQLMQLQQPFVPVSSSSKIPLNASYVIYTDSNGQLLDTLPVCQDFNRSMCSRLNCRFVHLTEDDKVEVCDQRVAVCRDHANGQCRRKQCKYYHIPIVLPPANIMAAIINNNNTTNNNNMNSNSSSSNSSNSSNSNQSNHSNQFQLNAHLMAHPSHPSHPHPQQPLTLQASPYDHEHLQQQHQQLQQQQTPSVIQDAHTNLAAIATATTNYNNNNNLIIIEPQPHFTYAAAAATHNNNISNTGYYKSNKFSIAIPATTTTTHGGTLYHSKHHHHHQQQQQQQQQQYYTQRHHMPAAAVYNCHSPYSPSSASSSSSCSIATSPTLSSATTLSTTSTATMPTPIAAITSNYAPPPLPPPQPTTYLKTAPTAFYDLTPTTPTLVLSSDYNSNCIPILTTTAAAPQQPPTAFIYTATQQPLAAYQGQQQTQHLLKFTQYQQQQVQQQQHQQQHQQHLSQYVASATASSVAAAAAAAAAAANTSTPLSSTVVSNTQQHQPQPAQQQ